MWSFTISIKWVSNKKTKIMFTPRHNYVVTRSSSFLFDLNNIIYVYIYVFNYHPVVKFAFIVLS